MSIPVTVGPPRVEHLHTRMAIGTSRPRLSWRTIAPPSWSQTSAELELWCDREIRRVRLDGDASVLVEWPFDALRSFQTVRARVRVHGAASKPSSDWSDWSTIQTGPLSADDWTAEAIGADEQVSTTPRPAVLLRRDFEINAKPEAAMLFASAHGLYELEINGVRVGDHELAPGWTSYEHRVRWDSHDVTALLRPGDNTIGAWVADGWYRGRLGWNGGHRDIYGTRTSLITLLDLRSPGGERSVITSDAAWRFSRAPITATGLLEGESYDTRLEQDGWSSPGFDDSGWSPVNILPFDRNTLEGPLAEPIRRIEERRPQTITESADGRLIVDFGQNLVGRVALKVRGRAGEVLRLRHAEVLEHGELATRPLRDATAEDSYVLRGLSGAEHWHPRFTIHGFRYAEISRSDGVDMIESITAEVLHTDMERIGWFECSDPLLERLHENIVWSMRGNFVGLPTDCPQRDERLGWTGDIQVFAPVATFLFDSAGLLTSWLRDVAAEQYDDGTVPWYVPEIPGGDWWTPARPGAGWGDAAVLVPWTLHRSFADRGVLSEQYATAKRWVDLIDSRTVGTGLWTSDFQLGDWLDPTAPPDRPAEGLTDPGLVATAYHSWSARRLAEIAQELGQQDDVARYTAMSARATAAFREEFVDEQKGLLNSDSQTSNALAIAFGLLDPQREELAGRNLVELVERAAGHLTTGFLGTPVLLEALSITHHDDAAFALLMQRRSPSWLHPISLGATTIWERWDSMLEDGSVNPGDMTSFNHYALGAVAEWMHARLAGLSADAPGYRKILVRPQPFPSLDFARARHRTPFGIAEAGWSRRTANSIEVTAEIPTGASARIVLPNGTEHHVGPGSHTFISADRLDEVGQRASAGNR